MDLCAFPDIDIDHLLGNTTTSLEDGFLEPFSRTKEKRSRLAERISQSDELIRQVKQLQIQNKQLADLQSTAQEVTDLYQKEKQQRLELQTQSKELSERCAELEKQLDAQVIQCENLQEELEARSLPVNAKEVLGLLLQLDQRLGDEANLTRRDQNLLKKLKDYCKTANISLPTPKSPCPSPSPNQRHKKRSQATQTDVALPEKPPQSTVAVQVENLVETRDQGTQHKKTTTTRGTTTASFIKKHDVGTGFPEPKPLPNVRQILDEMLSWREKPLRPLSPLCDLLPEMENISATVSVATCTTLCNIHREIDFISELPPQIKVSASRPPSRTMLDSVKEEVRFSAKEMLNFLPQNQSSLANLPPQAIEELWQVFGQMVLALLQRRSPTPTVSQADFSSWLHELCEGTQGHSAGKKDFSGSTEGLDMATDPIIASPNISQGGEVTPIRLPVKPREGKHRKSKKRRGDASLIKPIAKRRCNDAESSTQETEQQATETAIQFLSNLNTFNMENCDNLDMELDEEEMYLLQLTSKPLTQKEQEKDKEEECVSLPKVQEESEASLKDDKALENTKTTPFPDGITCKEASLPVLFLEESNPSELNLSSAAMTLVEPREKPSLTNLLDEPPTPPDTPPNDSDSHQESNLCKDQKANEGINFELSSFKEILVVSTQKTPEKADNFLYSSDSDTEDNSVKSLILNKSPCKSNNSQGDAFSNLFGSDSDLESQENEVDSIEMEKTARYSDIESEENEEEPPKEDTAVDPIKTEKTARYSDIESEESEPEELDTIESEKNVRYSDIESEESQEESSKEDTEVDSIETEKNARYSDIESEESEEETPKEDTVVDSIESERNASKNESQLFGSDSDLESVESEQGDSKEDTELVPVEKRELVPIEKKELKKEASKKTESCRKLLSTEETELELIDSEEEWLEIMEEKHNTTNLKTFDDLDDKLQNKLNKEHPLESTASLAVEIPADQTDLVPNSNLWRKMLLQTQLSSPALSSSDDSEDQKLIIDIESSPSIESSIDSPPVATCKRKRTLIEFKSPPTPGEGRLTRQKAKQMLLEQNCSTESSTTTLVEQIRQQLKQSLNKPEPLERSCYSASLKSVVEKGEESYRYNKDSPASPPPAAEPLEEPADAITLIPLEQHDGLQDDGQPKSIIQHVIDQYKAEPKLSQMRKKTLGKSQQKLCSAIGKYLKESLELEAMSLEVYKLTKNEAVIVNALVVLITQIGLEENPLQRLLSALKYFDFTQRFLAELEGRLFRNTKERPPTELAMKYVKLYLAAVTHQASDANPARLLLAKLLYHYEQDMPVTVLEVLRQFPTVLPHREEREYNHSDPLITVIKHLLMSRTYDMQNPEGPERLLLSKLRFEYHYQPFEPNKEQVLENLVEKLKAGRSLEQLGYAFALFCRRSPHIKVLDLVVTEHLMPLASSYSDESHDDRLVAVLQCISMVLKPLPLDTDISAFVGLVKRLIVAVPRPGVQQAAVQACLRLQRFGFGTIREALQNYRPDYPLEPLTRAMLRCFAERRKQYRILGAKK